MTSTSEAQIQSQPNERTEVVDACPRCGRDHGEVIFHRMDNPIEGPGGLYAWWWACSVTGAPVLAQQAWEEA